jgi:predicted acetyltransferase
MSARTDPLRAAPSPRDTDGLVLRPIAERELRSFRRCLATTYHLDLDWPDSDSQRARRILELDRTVAAFDGDELVGTAVALSLELSIPGGALPCAGVTWVSVLPTHRRRGIFAHMMNELLDGARKRGEPLAALWASEAGIYGRFGFGWAVSRLRLSVETSGLVPSRMLGSGAPWRIRFAELDGAATLLAPIHAAVSARRGGLTSRSHAWWEERVLDDRPDGRGGRSSKRLVVAFDGDGAARAYSIYRVSGIRSLRGTDHPSPGKIEVIELMADADDAAAALWRWLVGIDLVERVEALTRPIDDPLAFLFDDPRRVTLVEHSDSLWLRLVDVPRALEARLWACAATVVLKVRDERLPENDGIWRLTTAPGGPAHCERTSATPELELDVGDLGAAYLGGTGISRLVAAGRIIEHASGAADRLDAALRVERAAWSIDRF